MFKRIKIFLFLALIISIIPFIAFGLNSIILILEEIRPSIVIVLSDSGGISSGPNAAFRDPKTGRILIAKNIKAAKFSRQGAGVILDADGLAVTNAHNVQGSSRLTVKLNTGESLPATLLSYIPNEDIAFIKIHSNSKLRAITLANSDKIELGERVFNIGISELIRNSFQEAKITGVGQTSQTKRESPSDIDLIQVGFAVHKGDSGGPLINTNGDLIGMITAGQTKVAKTTYAIPSNKIKKYASQIK